jgi:hypothetical protein
MKKISLTENERKWLMPLLKSRMTTFLSEPLKVPGLYTGNLLSATDKLNADLSVQLKQWEKVMIESCTNERLHQLNTITQKPDVYQLIDSDDELKNQLEEIDTAYSILGKLKPTPTYKIRTSYREYFERLQKLKSSEMIYLSAVNGGSPYKIAFVHQGAEYCSFELGHPIELGTISFGRLNEDAVLFGRKKFHQVLSRDQAFAHLSQFGDNDYQYGQLPFLLHLLN